MGSGEEIGSKEIGGVLRKKAIEMLLYWSWFDIIIESIISKRGKGKMENKYEMTKEQNLFLAKRNIVDSIWKSANLEGICVTYPETESLLEGGMVEGLSMQEIVTINNLKHAWYFILENEEIPTNFNTLREINKVVGSNLIINCGNLRSTPVSIGGTDWKPPFPIESQIKEELEDLLKIGNPTERAISVMLWAMRRQMFLDGNKRTAMLFANKMMIENGTRNHTNSSEKAKRFFCKIDSLL